MERSQNAFIRLLEMEKQVAKMTNDITEMKTFVMTVKETNKNSGNDLRIEINRLRGDFNKYKSEIGGAFNLLKQENATASKDLWREFNRVQGAFDRHKTETERAFSCIKQENEKLAQAYNKAIGVINDLSERLAALEKNYDPTLIK